MSSQAGDPSNTLGGALFVEQGLQRGATLLTPNLRSARYWSRRFDSAQQAVGASTWTAANILPWRAWTTTLWHDAIVSGLDDRILLNEVQEQALWQNVITEHAAPTLKSVAAQARLCTSALRLLGQYDVDHRFATGQYPEDETASDTGTFARWFLRFEQVCSRDRLLPAAYLETELALAFRSDLLQPADEYVLWSFPEHTPSQQALLRAIQQAGSRTVSMHEQGQADGRSRLLTCGNARLEMQQCAAWLKDRLAAEHVPALVVVVPDLETARPELERELRAVAAPAAADVTHTADAPYEFSSGRPLSRLPLAADALRLLRWCAAPLALDDAAAVLRSRWVRLAPTPERGGELHLYLLQHSENLRAELSLLETARLLEGVDAASTGNLRALHRDSRELARSAHTFAEYADGVRRLLHDAGWAAQDLNSEEHQAVDRWNELLDELSTLDLLGARVSFAEFLHQLAARMGDTVFAPENRGAPVQVVSVEEAVGTPAEALWFLHAGEHDWPPTRSPHPLLPLSLQRVVAMPGTSSTLDEERSGRMLRLVLGDCGEAVFSYTAAVQESVQQPSSLVMRYVSEHGGASLIAEDAAPAEAAVALDTQDDTSVLPALPEGVLKGGVAILTAQAQCGFRAFAERRLFAVAPEQLNAGLSQQDRGTQIHSILQAFWTEAKDQATLLRLRKEIDHSGVNKRDALLRTCIEHVVTLTGDDPWATSYLQVQRERLQRLLQRWLDMEADSRTPFTVLYMEREVPDPAIGPLHLRLRVDRIDRMGNAGITEAGDPHLLLIDYKTGKAAASDWDGPRPNQPQLPLYAVARVESNPLPQVRGMAFGLVRVQKDGMCLNGVAEPGMLKATRKEIDFEERLVDWYTDLEALATAFATGDAALDPKEYPKTCDTCLQRLLCRIDEEKRLQVDDPEEAEEAWSWG